MGLYLKPPQSKANIFTQLNEKKKKKTMKKVTQIMSVSINNHD